MPVLSSAGIGVDPTRLLPSLDTSAGSLPGNCRRGMMWTWRRITVLPAAVPGLWPSSPLRQKTRVIRNPAKESANALAAV